MSTPETFADKLKAHRKRLRLTQEDTAIFLGVDTRTIYLWEKGQAVREITQEGALARFEKERKPWK